MSYYQKLMQDKDHQEAGLISVTVNGNRDSQTYNLPRLKANRADLSLSKCNDICAMLKKDFGLAVTDLYFSLSRFDYSVIRTEADAAMVAAGDCGVPLLKDSHARYCSATNTLIIYEYGMPVYENANGVITRDPEAL